MGECFFNILAAFAEFEVDLLRMRTREGMAVARVKGKLRGNRTLQRHNGSTSITATVTFRCQGRPGAAGRGDY